MTIDPTTLTDTELLDLYVAARTEARRRNLLGLSAATQGDALEEWKLGEAELLCDSSGEDLVDVTWAGYTGAEIDQEIRYTTEEDEYDAFDEIQEGVRACREA